MRGVIDPQGPSYPICAARKHQRAIGGECVVNRRLQIIGVAAGIDLASERPAIGPARRTRQAHQSRRKDGGRVPDCGSRDSAYETSMMLLRLHGATPLTIYLASGTTNN